MPFSHHRLQLPSKCNRTVYWVIYFQAYLAAVGLLLWHYWGDLSGGDRLMRVYLLAAIFGSAAGGSAVFTIVVEAGGYMVLLIPARIKKLKNEGREEGIEVGREAGLTEGRGWGKRLGTNAIPKLWNGSGIW